MSEQLKARITTKGPKKILALDGGGIRRMITVEVLAGIENLLRQPGWARGCMRRWIAIKPGRRPIGTSKKRD